MHALTSLAHRHSHLGEEIAQLEQRTLTRATTALLAIKGIGPVIGAQLC